MSKTIIVSNRLPVKISKTETGFKTQTSEGGLATGLGSIYKKGDNCWVGWPGAEVDGDDEKKEIQRELSKLSLMPVFLSQQEIEEFYEGFSNSVLWPVFHYYVSTYANYKLSNWQYYQQVNQKFADAVVHIAKPGDIIWVHDYQLLLVPQLIRKALPDVSIGFFLHIPFPSHEMFRLIPWRSELLQGILGADLVGFHTYDDVRHFLSAVTRILPVPVASNMITYNERSVVAEAFPMGIDDRRYAELPLEAEVKKHIKEIKHIFKNNKIILSIDRLDYSKGILQRLQAYELLLDKHPECIGHITLYMIVVPSRDTVPQYKELRDQIDKRAGNINSRYRTIGWSPIQYYYRSVPIETLSALYATADVCLVTPMRDGMNLVSKEYVASRIHNDGVLVLSEMAGASKELIDAIIVNPNNANEICEAVINALNMPLNEQRERMKQMRQIVTKFNITHWVRVFMDRLHEVKLMQRSLLSRHVGSNTEQSIINRYLKTSKRIIFLDYDGTLVEFASTPGEAVPNAELKSLLDGLLADTANQVVLISGRKHENLDEWFGNSGLYLIAEHGAWSKKPGEAWMKIQGLSKQWKNEIRPVLEIFVDRTPGSLIEEKSYSLVWHYRKAQRGLGELRANELTNTLKYLATDKGLQLLPGDKVVEIKNVEVNKGKAALTLVEENNYDFVMALGDDYTDEDIFRALPDTAVTIKVGNNLSAAKFYLNHTTEVRHLLKSLLAGSIVEAGKQEN